MNNTPTRHTRRQPSPDGSTALLVKGLANLCLFKRKEAKLIQKEFAERLGVSFSTYCRLEAAERPPDLATCMKVAKGLDLSVAQLLGTAATLGEEAARYE